MNDTEMDVKTDTLNQLEPVPLRYGLTTVVVTMFFFQMINKYLSSATGFEDNKATSKYSRKEWQQRNLIISWIHALIVSVWDILA